MKKLIFVLALLVVAIDGFSQIGIGFGTGGFGVGMNIPVNGRKNSQRNNRLENQVQQLKKDLDLNDDQVIKIRGLLMERNRMNERGEKMTNDEFDRRMQHILTSEQLSKYNDLKQQKRSERKQNEPENKKEPLPQSDWDDVYR